MKILYRYLFISILKPLIFSTVALFALWLIYDLFDSLPDFVGQPQASVSLAFQFYFAQFPKVAQSIIPVAFFFTTLYVLAYLSSYQELVAMQANGSSLARICWPFFLIGAALALLLLFLNFNLTPSSEVQRRAIKEKIQGRQGDILRFQNVIYRNPKNGTVWYLKEIDARTGIFQKGEILLRDANGNDKHKLFAEKGEFKDDYWTLKDVRWVNFSADGNVSSKILPDMRISELSETPQQLVAALRPPDEMTWQELAAFLRMPHPRSSSFLAPYLTEHYRRMAHPLICLVLCFFGIAMGASHQRRHIAASAFNSVFVLFAMLVWLNFSAALGNGARIGPWLAAWNGIFVFGGIGFYLFAIRTGWVWLWRFHWQKWLMKRSPFNATPQ
ncbi:MAG: LptF/LptG family permease [bacterium]